MGNYSPSRSSVGGDHTISTNTANATGGGFDGAAGVTIYVGKFNGEIITTILVDIEDLLVSGTVKDVIGEDGVDAAYITRITTAVNGLVYKVEMACVETPAGSNITKDIDLIGNSQSDIAEDEEYDGAGTDTPIITAGGDWKGGISMTTASGADLNALLNDYLYLANGSGANSGGTYTGGKFIIKLYGASF